jgi:hypothetical protein
LLGVCPGTWLADCEDAGFVACFVVGVRVILMAVEVGPLAMAREGLICVVAVN